MTVVGDASVVVAALVDPSSVGTWGESLLALEPLAAPHHMPGEAANILRRLALADDISDDVASLAHDDLVALRIELFPYQPFATRVWQLRSNMSAYDAWYVALAESLDAGLATLDAKLSRALGARCEFLLPSRPRRGWRPTAR
jgi:predicted nucleic acid-binding protein